MTSLTFQLSQAVGASQAPGRSASVNIRLASSRTTRRMVGFPAYVIAFHSSLMPYLSIGGVRCLTSLLGQRLRRARSSVQKMFVHRPVGHTTNPSAPRGLVSMALAARLEV